LVAASTRTSDPSALVLSDPTDLPLLKDPQELHLHPGETSPTSSRSRVPLLAASKSPGRSAVAPGEGTAGVTEELGLEEGLGDRPAVDRDERTEAAGGLVVDEPGDPLLARTALAGDEYRGVDLGHPSRQVHHLLHGPAPGDDAQGRDVVAGHPHQRPPALAELPLRRLECLGDAMERNVETLLQPLGFKEVQLVGALVAPLLPRPAEEVTGGVPFPTQRFSSTEITFPLLRLRYPLVSPPMVQHTGTSDRPKWRRCCSAS
jgi:hypothetical protein